MYPTNAMRPPSGDGSGWSRFCSPPNPGSSARPVEGLDLLVQGGLADVGLHGAEPNPDPGMSEAAATLDAGGHRLPHRARRAGAQPAQRHARTATRSSDRVHRPVRFREVLAGLRHDLRRGPASLRRVAVRLRAAVPGADGEARRRLHRGPQPGDLDRPEVHLAQPAVHRGDHHRGLRLPAGPLRPGGPSALLQLRPSDRTADARADRRPGHGAARGHAVPGPRTGRPRPQR